MAMSKVKNLQLWCKKMAEGYHDVEVRDMDASWKSGLAFCAIIHRFRPDLIDYDSLAKENIFDNNQLAYEVAQKQLNIPAFLEAADMVAIRVPDRLSVITYISQYYNYFYNKPQLGGPGVNKFGPSSKKKACVQKDEKLDRTIVEDTIMNRNRLESIGDKCCICHEKVYLLERCIENNKLYHRICARESDSSSTSKVFKRPPLTSVNDDRVDLTNNKVRKIENEESEPVTKTSAARESEPNYWKRRAEQKAAEVTLNPVSSEVKATTNKSEPTVVGMDKSKAMSVSSDKPLAPTVDIKKSSVDVRKSTGNAVSSSEKGLEKPELQTHNIETKLKDLDNKKLNNFVEEPDTVTPIPKPRNVTKKQALDIMKLDPKIQITVQHLKQDENKLKTVPIVNKQNASLGLNLKQEKTRPVSNDLSPLVPPSLPVSSPPVLPLFDSSHVPTMTHKEPILQKSQLHSSNIKVDQDRQTIEAKMNVGELSLKGQKRHLDIQLNAPLTISNMNVLNTGSRDSKNVNEAHKLRTEKPDLKQSNATPSWQTDNQVKKESLKSSSHENVANTESPKSPPSHPKLSCTSPKSGPAVPKSSYVSNKSLIVSDLKGSREPPELSVTIATAKKGVETDEFKIDKQGSHINNNIVERVCERKTGDVLITQKQFDKKTAILVRPESKLKHDSFISEPYLAVNEHTLKDSDKKGVNETKNANTPNYSLKKIHQKESSSSSEPKKFENGPQLKRLIPDKIVASLVAAKSKKERTQESLEMKNEIGNEILWKQISVTPNFLLDDIKHGPEKGTSSVVNQTSSDRTSKPFRPPLPSTRHHISVYKIQNKLKHIARELSKLEHKGRTLEDRIRKASEEDEEKLMKDWFQLVNNKNELIRKEHDYIYISESQELEIKQEQIEQQLQELLNTSDEERTEEDRKLEEELIIEKIAIVDQRSNIVECIDEDRIRYLEEDHEIQTTLSLPGILKSPRQSVQEESHILY